VTDAFLKNHAAAIIAVFSELDWLLLYGLSFSGRYLSSSIKPQSRTNQNGKANHERPQESA